MESQSDRNYQKKTEILVEKPEGRQPLAGVIFFSHQVFREQDVACHFQAMVSVLVAQDGSWSSSDHIHIPGSRTEDGTKKKGRTKGFWKLPNDPFAMLLPMS